MDGKDFDDIAQKLGSVVSRRRALGGIAAGLLGATGLAAVAEAKNAGKTKSAGKGKGNKHKVGKKQTCTGCTANIGVAVCLGGVDEFACGSNGQLCVTCSNDGNGRFQQVCAPNTNGRGGSCQIPAGCSGNNTPPQCQTGTTCVTRGTSSSCGSRNVPTTQILGGNANTTVCNAVCQQGNICSGPNNDAFCVSQQCGPNTINPCTNGCCDGNTCVVAGTDPARCGTGGVICTVNCRNAFGPNAVCQTTGTCSGSAACGTNSAQNPCLNGCCDGANCLAAGSSGQSAAKCGTGGGTCAACPAGFNCTNGQCVQPGPCCGTGCAATPCANGCCSGNTCIAPGRNTQCGPAGGACTATCGGKKHKCCVAGVCKKKGC